MEYLEIGARRDAYSVDDVIRRTLTVGELVDILEEYEDDTPVVLSHDSGYTYGALHEGRITLERTDDEEVDEEGEEEIEADDSFSESFDPDEDSSYSKPTESLPEDKSTEFEGKRCGESLDENCIHCGDDDDDFESDDDFGEHENSYDVDEAYSFKGLNDRFGGRTLAESLRPRTIKRKKK